MPLIPFQHQFIDVPIRPLERTGLTFQRRLRYKHLSPAQDPESGEMVILLTVQVDHFRTQADGTPGLDARELIAQYEETFRADNTEAIDLATGEVVHVRVQQTEAEWQAQLAADPRNLILRGDAYEATMHSGAVDMVPQIRAAMLAADGPPYYRFGGPSAPEAAPGS